MEVFLKSTSRIVTVLVKGGEIQARVWEGATDSGIPVYALIPRIATPAGAPQDEFKRELQEHAAPSADALQVFPLRMLI